jgi:hypothetical protein
MEKSAFVPPAEDTKREQAEHVLHAINTVAGITQQLFDSLVELSMEGSDDDIDVDQWWLGIARANFQTAFLAARKSIDNNATGF